ncbi:MAG: ribonuclease III domain-containing protein [Candidatus Hodarchaeota archaeon]
MIEKDKLRKFQEFIKYEFKNDRLLAEALTTPKLANEIGAPSYDFLETLGDAVIKVIFILKLYRIGIKDSGNITKIKSNLESDNAIKKVANRIKLENYIFKTEDQKIKGTRILADVFEAICGALFLDSDCNLSLIEKKIIDAFYEDLDIIIQNSLISSKNVLLEFLQDKFKVNVIIELEYTKRGHEHDPIWIAKNPKIFEAGSQKELIMIAKDLKSAKFKNKKDAEKDIYAKILKYLEKKRKFKI